MKKWQLVSGLIVAAQLCSAGAWAVTPAANVDSLVMEFVYQSLALSPVAASAAGYHVHDKLRLDGVWDDYSAAGLDKRRQFNRQLLQRLDALQHAGLDPERLADLDVIRDAVNLELLELDR